MAAHIASPHSRRAPQKGLGRMPLAAQEDIGAVLERFHKWAGQQQKPVRELTYEEAVARSSRRVHVEDDPPRPEPVKAAASPAPTLPPPPIQFPMVNNPPPFEAPAKPSRPSPGKTAESGKNEASGNKPATATAAEPAATRRKSAKSASSGKALPAKMDSARTKTTAGAKPRAVKANPAIKSAPKAETPAEPEAAPASQATFEQVLAAQVQPPVMEPPPHAAPDALEVTDAAPPTSSLAVALTGVASVAPLPEDKPAVHLTMRLSPDERAALRQRAGELGMTPAAYVRQCALEMNLLREKLENVHRSQKQAVSQPAERGTSLSLKRQNANLHAGKKPWLQRLKHFLFPNKVKGQTFAARV